MPSKKSTGYSTKRLLSLGCLVEEDTPEPPREGAVIEISVPLSCFAWVDGPKEATPAIVTRVYSPNKSRSPVSCVVMEPGHPPELRLIVEYGFGALQWHWPN